MQNFTSSSRNRKRSFKMLKKCWGAFRTECMSNSKEDLFRGIKLPGESCKKRGGESHTELNNYSSKDIRGNITGGQFLTEIICYSCKNITT